MPLFKGRKQHTTTPGDGASTTRFHNQQDLLDHLDEEIFRAERYKRALVVLCVAPQLTAGSTIHPADVAAAREAVSAQLRFSDRVGTLDDGSMVAILPETDVEEARVVASRIANDLTIRSAGTDRRKWLVGTSSFPDDGPDPPAMVAAAMRRAQG